MDTKIMEEKVINSLAPHSSRFQNEKSTMEKVNLEMEYEGHKRDSTAHILWEVLPGTKGSHEEWVKFLKGTRNLQ